MVVAAAEDTKTIITHIILGIMEVIILKACIQEQERQPLGTHPWLRHLSLRHIPTMVHHPVLHSHHPVSTILICTHHINNHPSRRLHLHRRIFTDPHLINSNDNSHHQHHSNNNPTHNKVVVVAAAVAHLHLQNNNNNNPTMELLDPTRPAPVKDPRVPIYLCIIFPMI